MKNIFRLDHKIVVITGAAGLLGQRHARAVAASGGHPILLDLHSDRVEEIALNLSKEFSVEARGYCVDITKEDSIRKNCQEICKYFGRIDALVNNAANNPKMEQPSDKNFSRLENFDLNVWNADIAVGLSGSFLASKHYGYEISKNKDGGSILNIASDLGLIAPDQRLYRKEGLSEDMQPVKPVTYSVVKSGLIGLTRYLATYWADKGVRANAICPGGVENNQDPSFVKGLERLIPMGRMARQDEYQGILVFLLSEASSYLNGAIIPVDGGRSVW